jgi:hypothetical protein
MLVILNRSRSQTTTHVGFLEVSPPKVRLFEFIPPATMLPGIHLKEKVP